MTAIHPQQQKTTSRKLAALVMHPKPMRQGIQLNDDERKTSK